MSALEVSHDNFINQLCYILVCQLNIFLLLNVTSVFCAPLQQGEDVALPEVPTEPIPEVPEAVKPEQGKGCFFYFLSNYHNKPLCFQPVLMFALLSFLVRKEAQKKPDKEMLAA